ncbi:MAG TPA: hypothetical protein VD886_12755 [Herpetosiphonaceae bacterium]|nr:hypothetical protein [Herpetosiphonaceae bacterium]
MSRRLAAIVLALVFAGGVWQGLRSAAGPPSFQTGRLAALDEEHATILIELERDAAGQPVLAATFQPKKPDLHLYSKDTPRAGVEGLGRPTLLELAAGAPVAPRGSLITDAEAYPEPDGLTDEPLLIYPAGPVTLRLPIEAPEPGAVLPIALTYMLCSDRGYCTAPVESKAVKLSIP